MAAVEHNDQMYVGYQRLSARYFSLELSHWCYIIVLSRWYHRIVPYCTTHITPKAYWVSRPWRCCSLALLSKPLTSSLILIYYHMQKRSHGCANGCRSITEYQIITLHQLQIWGHNHNQILHFLWMKKNPSHKLEWFNKSIWNYTQWYMSRASTWLSCAEWALLYGNNAVTNIYIFFKLDIYFVQE